MPHPIIGVLSPLLAGVYFGGLLHGVNLAVRRRGGQLFAVQTLGEDFGMRQQRFEQPLAWAHVDAWVAVVEAVNLEYLMRIKETGKPVVTLSTYIPALGCPAVLPDNRGGTAAAVRHLLDHGHERIAFVGNMNQEDIRERYAGYQLALQERGLTSDPALLIAIPDNMQEGGRSAVEQLAADQLPCSAIVAATDQNAIGIMSALHEAGYRVPQHVAVTGFDDMELARYIRPPLTTVRQRFDALGSAAADLALAMLDGEVVPPTPHYSETFLIRRRSCGCMPGARLPVEPISARQADWKRALEAKLVELAVYPLSPDRTVSPRQIWPGVELIVDALEQTTRTARLAHGDLIPAWGGAIPLISDPSAPQMLIKLIEQSAAAILGRRRHFPIMRSALKSFSDHAQADLTLAWQMAERDERLYLDMIMRHTYRVTLDLLMANAGTSQDLGWLKVTPMRWACLGLWTDSHKRELMISGSYTTLDAPVPTRGMRFTTHQFPPQEALEAVARLDDGSVAFLLPIKTVAQDWGMIALVGPIEHRINSGLGATGQWAALLSVAVERESLLAHQAEQQEILRHAYERAQALANTVRELGSPVIPLLPGVLLVPLVGAIEAERAQHFIESVLTGIAKNNARVVLLDITGVPLVNTQVANSLIHATRAATLLGASVIMVGVRPEIAQTIVGLGIDLEHIVTQPTLATALESLLRRHEV